MSEHKTPKVAKQYIMKQLKERNKPTQSKAKIRRSFVPVLFDTVSLL